MSRRLLRLWMCWCTAVFIALGCLCVGSAFAQTTRHENSLMGASDSVIADWQREYGGGRALYGWASGHVPYWYVQPAAPPVFMEPCPPKKAKRSKALKKSDRN